ncbi:hypothetical protein [Haloarchaeobius amylolyticus]|uniref:hypothetical protein n=1 Tax=Haloarchaeobius amylolyticus TaxID=1198296 RepID=UPI002270A365|nr:hypothetical protein [Haloarchaeobius amylolyticus]
MSTQHRPTGPWHWYVVVGYPIVGLVAVAALALFARRAPPFATTLAAVAAVAGLTSLTGVAYPALYFDCRALRATTHWRPRWRRYVGLGIVLPFLLGGIAGYASGLAVGLLTVLVAVPVAALAVTIAYLVRRNRAVGLDPVGIAPRK